MIVNYETGTCEVLVDGKPQSRKFYVDTVPTGLVRGLGRMPNVSRIVPETHSNERLLEAIGKDPEIITVGECPPPEGWNRSQGYYGEIAPPMDANQWDSQRYRRG